MFSRRETDNLFVIGTPIGMQTFVFPLQAFFKLFYIGSDSGCLFTDRVDLTVIGL